MTSPGKGVGGLPPRRPDQQPVAPPTAVSPGSSNITRARLVIISGASDGLFVDDGTPAAGRANGQVTIVSGGLSGQALQSDNTFQGPLSLPLPNQSNDNTTLAGVLTWSNNLTTNMIAAGLMLP